MLLSEEYTNILPRKLIYKYFWTLKFQDKRPPYAPNRGG